MSKELNEHLTRMYPVIIQDRSTVVENMVTGGDTIFYARGHEEMPFASIGWQDGVIDPEKGANGVTLEAMIQASIARLQAFQNTKFKCRENALAITALEQAKNWLMMRREDRFFRDVLNKHEV